MLAAYVVTRLVANLLLSSILRVIQWRALQYHDEGSDEMAKGDPQALINYLKLDQSYQVMARDAAAGNFYF